MNKAKESLKRIVAWIKKNPYLAAGIGLGIGLLIYLATRGGGDSEEDSYTQTLDAGGSAGDLTGLGSSAGSMPDLTASTPVISPLAPIAQSSGGESSYDPGIGSFGEMSFSSDGGFGAFDSMDFSSLPAVSAGSAASIISNSAGQKTNLLPSKPVVNTNIPIGGGVNQKVNLIPSKPAPVASKPVSTIGGGIGSKPKPAPKPAPVASKPVSTIGGGIGSKPKPAPKPAPVALNIYTGYRPGYNWSSILKRYVPTLTGGR